MNNKLYYFFIPFTVIGIISIVLLLFGYRPVITEVEPDWLAVSSIGTLLAVATALFITKWQEIIDNKKVIKIEWLHAFRTIDTRTIYQGFKNDRRIDEICIKFTNIGNRKVILGGAYILFPNKYNVPLLSLITLEQGKTELPIPCILKKEMVTQLQISYHKIISAIYTSFQDGFIKENDKIIIVAYDTTGKKYFYNTNIKFNSYIKNHEELIKQLNN